MAFFRRVLQTGRPLVQQFKLFGPCGSSLHACPSQQSLCAKVSRSSHESPVMWSRLSKCFSYAPHHENDPEFEKMTNEELEDTSTIPGWELIHSPPRTYPKGALVGTVVSDKMQKTVNVAVDRYRIVPKIRKRVKYTRKFFAHDENEVASLGDIVLITPCHRISKHKHFLLREVIRPKGQL